MVCIGLLTIGIQLRRSLNSNNKSAGSPDVKNVGLKKASPLKGLSPFWNLLLSPFSGLGLTQTEAFSLRRRCITLQTIG
jgi:hypothetical protein